MVRHALATVLLALALTACSKPNAPDKEQPPEPQAASAMAHAPDGDRLS